MTDAAQRVIDEARAICAVPAPTFAEGPRAELVAELFVGAGVTPAADAAGNVLAALGDGPADETVVLAAHLDTVFDAATEIAFGEHEGRLAAPGIGDNSLAVAALVHLARRLAGRPLARPLLLAATVGEEGLGDLRGAKALVVERPCAAFVAVEGMTLDSITTAAVGSLRFRLTVRGPGGHPWGDRGTASAVHGLVLALAALLDAVTDPAVVLNVGVIHGGTVINAIAGEASAEIDLRCEDDARPAGRRRAGARARPPRSRRRSPWRWTSSAIARAAGSIPPTRCLPPLAGPAPRSACRPPSRTPPRPTPTPPTAAGSRRSPSASPPGPTRTVSNEYVDTAPVGAGLAALDALVDELTR